MTEQLAPDADIEALTASLQSSDADDIAAIDALISTYPDDPRLHFMRGSVLAGQSKHIEAHEALSKAVEIAPEFAIARYQLGFFELTSGEADRALSTWGPLLKQAKDNYLRVFVEGMTFLIRDEFDDAITKFETGIALNQDNPPMNDDIRLLMRELRNKADGSGPDTSADAGSSDSELSATSLLLGQLGGTRTIN